jgi:hypothetical protein
MDTIFDLSKIKSFIEEKRPKCIIITDTCFLMNEPKHLNWKTDLGDTLWILYSSVLVEVERKKRDRNNETAKKAKRLCDNLTELINNKGLIANGFQLENDQSYISIPTPSKALIEKALKDLPSMRNAYGDTDIELLLLTRHISSLTQDISVIMCTADEGLYRLLSSNGHNAILFAEGSTFPLKVKEKEWHYPTKTDWNAIADEIEKDLKASSVPIELTLVSKTMSEPKSGSSFILAEGSGLIHGKTVISFTWKAPFSKLLYQGGGDFEFDQVPGPTIDFGQQDNEFNPEIKEYLKNKLEDLVHPPHIGSYFENILIDPSSISKLWLKQHIKKEVLQSFGSVGDDELFASSCEILEGELGITEYSHIIYDLVLAHHNYWNVGDRLMLAWFYK